ncbi:hypothetical protein [Mesorhizobium sp. M0060]|uniref:hypothetical protein n=1 Tax=Mesorhizobium sp. M0060 TaxID=2956866 RepID=UPI00333C0591
MIAAAESSGRAAPDTGDVVVIDGPVADVDPKLGQFRVSFTAYSTVPTEWHRRFYQGVTAAFVVGSSTMSDMRHSAIRVIALL